MKHLNTKNKPLNIKRYIIWTMISLIIVLSILSVKSYIKNSNEQGEYDDFAKCLSEKGAIIYGNDFCSYTIKQLNFFGKSKKYLNYIKCADNEELCDNKGVSITPTWEINNKTYSGVQTFEALSGFSDCRI